MKMEDKQKVNQKSEAMDIFACENNVLQYIIKPDAKLIIN